MSKITKVFGFNNCWNCDWHDKNRDDEDGKPYCTSKGKVIPCGWNAKCNAWKEKNEATNV